MIVLTDVTATIAPTFALDRRPYGRVAATAALTMQGTQPRFIRATFFSTTLLGNAPKSLTCWSLITVFA